MAFNPAIVHRAIATQIRNVAAIASVYNVAPWVEAGKPPPVIEVRPGGQWISYFETFGTGGRADMSVVIWIRTVSANAETELDRVSAVMAVGTGETASIVDALLADETLGGVAETIRILNATTEITEDGSVEIEIPVEVTLKKTGAQA